MALFDIEEIKRLVSEGNTEEAIALIANSSSSKMFVRETTLLMSRLKDLSTNKIRGLISPVEATLELNKINSAVIDLIYSEELTVNPQDKITALIKEYWKSILLSVVIIIFILVSMFLKSKNSVKEELYDVLQFNLLDNKIDSVYESGYSILSLYEKEFRKDTDLLSIMGKTFYIPLSYSLTLVNKSNKDIDIINWQFEPVFMPYANEDAIISSPSANKGVYQTNDNRLISLPIPFTIKKNEIKKLTVVIHCPIVTNMAIEKLLNENFINREDLQMDISNLQKHPLYQRAIKNIKQEKKGNSTITNGPISELLGLTLYRALPTLPLRFHQYKNEITSEDVLAFFKREKMDIFGRPLNDSKNIQFLMRLVTKDYEVTDTEFFMKSNYSFEIINKTYEIKHYSEEKN